MKARKKVLIFIDWYLPGYKAGGPIQSCANLVANLGADYDFHIVTRDSDYCSDIPYSSVEPNTWNKLHQANCYYISTEQLTYSRLKQLIKEVQPNIVYINGIYSYYFSILPLVIAKRLDKAKIIIAGRGMFASSAVNVKSGKKKIFFYLANLLNLYRGVQFHATNESERKDILTLAGQNAFVIVAPNLPAMLADQPNLSREKKTGQLRIVSVARVSPEKNTAYALEVLTKYRGDINIAFDLFGPVYAEEYWRECKSLMEAMPANVKVSYKGSLEKEQVSKTLSQYHALFLPTRGENFGHIILESLSAGCGIVISDQTPWKDLHASGVGYDLPLHDIQSFLDALQELGELDQEGFNALSDRAFNFAKAYSSNEENIEANRRLFA